MIRTTNQGLVHARNNGIRESAGEYILPLDADDRIGASYLEKAVEVLDSRPEIGIVYCEAELFGARTGKWDLPGYEFPAILIQNMIFCSGFFRRADWEAVNGYNPNMIYGFEDHDFWLSLIELGRDVYRIPETLFFYRQTPGSMLDSITTERLTHGYTQMYRNHPRLYSENMGTVVQYIFGLHAKIRDLTLRVEELEEARALATR